VEPGKTPGGGFIFSWWWVVIAVDGYGATGEIWLVGCQHGTGGERRSTADNILGSSAKEVHSLNGAAIAVGDRRGM